MREQQEAKQVLEKRTGSFQELSGKYRKNENRFPEKRFKWLFYLQTVNQHLHISGRSIRQAQAEI